MHKIVAFLMGLISGGGVMAVYYRRAAVEMEKLRQEILARVGK